MSEFEVFDLITVPPAISEAEDALRVLVLETASMSIFILVVSSLKIDEPTLGSIPLLLKVDASPATALSSDGIDSRGGPSSCNDDATNLKSTEMRYQAPILSKRLQPQTSLEGP